MILHTILDVFMQSIMISFLVMMLMILIEYLQIKTQTKWNSRLLEKRWIQIIFAALVGLIPGCIGGFMMVSLFTHKVVGFGALVATLITSFGDEAFFLYSFMPQKAILLASVLFGLGLLFGFIVDNIPFFKKQIPLSTNHTLHTNNFCCSHSHEDAHKNKNQLWKKYILIGFAIAFILSIVFKVFDHDHHPVFENLTPHVEHVESCHDENETCLLGHISLENFLFLFISFATLILLFVANIHFVIEHAWNHVIKKHFVKIFLWTFFILMFIQIGLEYVHLESIISDSIGKVFILLLAVLIGIIPQSGPHLIFIFLFINGMLPFSIVLANSIVQEGHSGLLLIAESRKHFTWIKFIKIIIALIVGLSGLFLGF